MKSKLQNDIPKRFENIELSELGLRFSDYLSMRINPFKRKVA